MPDPMSANADTTVTAHEVGIQSANEGFPGGAVGGMLGAVLVWLAQVLEHPLDPALAMLVTGGCGALGAWLSGYILARRRRA